MNIKSFTRFLLSVFALSAFCLLPLTTSAQLTWSGTQTFNTSTTINENITLIGNVTVYVGEQVSVIITGVISGNYSLTKTGVGDLAFTNNNTYTGGTTISQGGIYLGNNTPNGGVTGNIVNNGTVIFYRQTSYTYSGIISGTGNVLIIRGYVYFTSDNTYTGITEISSQGSLIFGNNTPNGSVAGNIFINDASYLHFSRTTNVVYSGVISGTGEVWIGNNNSVTLNGVCTYTGETGIFGMLILGTNGSIENSRIIYMEDTPNAVLDISAGDKKIKRLGYYNDLGTNTKIILGANILTIQDGGEFFGVISGTGGIIKAGTEILTLGGVNTYTGETVIMNGTLELDVNGTIANSSDVTLGGATAKLDISQGDKTIKNLNCPTGVGEVVLGSKTLTIGTAGQSDGGGYYSGAISGTGNVIKTGTGTLTFPSASTNTATTFTHQSGTVSLSGVSWMGDYNKLPGTTLIVLGNPILGSLTLAGGTIKMDLKIDPPGRISVMGIMSASGTNTLDINTNPITDYVLIAAISGIGSTTPYTVNSSLYTHLDATGKQLILNASDTPLIPAITTITLPDGVIGKEYSQTLAANGTTPITWTIENGNLPNGLSLDANGTVSGIPTTVGTFNFTVKAANNYGFATKTLPITITEEIGIDEPKGIASVQVFPNPTNGELTIDNGQLKIENIDIYDVMGKKIIVNSQFSIINSINIEHLPNGIYFIKITTETGTVTKKIIKN